MNSGSWNQRAFWLVCGLAVGMIVSDLLSPTPLHAVGTGVPEESMIATGGSNNPQVELVWLLDYRTARLLCYLFSENGQPLNVGSLDLKQVFGLERGKPKFMMVTGRFIGTNIAHACYLAETTTGQLAVVMPPGQSPRGQQLPNPYVIYQSTYQQP